MDADSIGQNSLPIGDAIREVQEALKNAGLDTSQRIALSMAERAALAEGKIKSIKRNFWSAILDVWSDEDADDLIARLMKRAENKKR